jgi:hypothetical protein
VHFVVVFNLTRLASVIGAAIAGFGYKAVFDGPAENLGERTYSIMPPICRLLKAFLPHRTR